MQGDNFAEQCSRLQGRVVFPGVPSLVVFPKECFGLLQSISHSSTHGKGVRTWLTSGWSGLLRESVAHVIHAAMLSPAKKGTQELLGQSMSYARSPRC
jgi:hypothetical protein